MAFKRRGRGLIGDVVNKVIDYFPFEIKLPGGYEYCGINTPLKEKLAKGVAPINSLDRLCQSHDFAYDSYKDTQSRNKADKILQEGAWNRVVSGNASAGERIAALAVAGAMKAKRTISGGGKRRVNKKIKKTKSKAPSAREIIKRLQGAGLYLRPYPTKGGGGGKKKKRPVCKRKKKRH